MGGLRREMKGGGSKKKLSEYFAVFHISSLSTVPLSMAATPPVTSHIAIQEVFLGLPFFGKVRRWGGCDIGLETCYGLASRTDNQATQ